ncbi:hypothetical protein GH714_027132 [Hevea brasiliensis]|uniref:Uncharacterized protein n=1 Tax=Hevea brasiliensis TaxID=3981 RepID=A0A6A6LST7_HEVBR|nr:hypothetical protein GH714_027132 [Hevea brasiliensis]
MASVYIPVQNSEEEVRVALDQLPRDASDILDILKAEQAPLDLWLIIAREYFKQGKLDQFRQILEEGSSHGQLLLAKGELEQASNAFKIVLEGDRDNVSALLGQACVEYNRGHYSDSLVSYKRALQVYPNCPGAVRLGIGHCYYKMGNFKKASQAFERVLQLDPENVEALVALAILDLQTNEAAGIRRGVEKMQKAFEIYPYCAMALNYLANHFFFTGQHFLVEQLTETALAVTNHGPTKSHSYYNLARSYHSKGDYETASRYYWASVKEINKPSEFVFPYYGLGQVQLKLGDIKNALSNFEKVLEVYPDNCETLKVLGHIYVQLGQTEKSLELLRKATKIDPRDAQAFLDLGELLISSDAGAALDAFKTAYSLLKKGGQEVPIEVLNNIGVIYFEREELKLALETFKEALGDGIWRAFLDSQAKTYTVDAAASILQYKDMQLFHRLEEDGFVVELPWDKVTALFNLARLLEQMHNTETANYVDAYLRLAAIAKARNNLQLSIELVNDALKVNDKCPNALSMLGDLELKNDEWVKAKETFRAASEATDGKDSYAILSLGNWNYFAAIRNEKRNPKLEATHLEKAKELYTRVLVQHTANLYAANGAGVVLAEKGHFDVSKDLFTQYQNCLRKFYYNTDSQILLYLARTHYEAEQWQDCKKTLLRAIHLAPSNYILRFDAGVAMQKFSASTLQKTKRTVDEVRSTVDELENAVRLFSQLSASSNLHFHGFDEKKINTHVEYCKHLLDAAKVHREAAEREEQQNRQRQEVARQMALAERKPVVKQKNKGNFRSTALNLLFTISILERRKQEDEAKRVRQQEEHFERVKEQWKSSTPASKRRDRSEIDDDEGGHSEKRRRKGGKKRRKDKSSKSHYEMEENEADMMDDHEELEDEDANVNYREHRSQGNDYDENTEENAQELLAAAGLEDSDAEDEAPAPSSTSRRRRAWSESDDDEALERKPQSSPVRENSAELQESDGEIREDVDKQHGDAAMDDED